MSNFYRGSHSITNKTETLGTVRESGSNVIDRQVIELVIDEVFDEADNA